jgi:hypothetical protein
MMEAPLMASDKDRFRGGGNLGREPASTSAAGSQSSAISQPRPTSG